MARMRYIKPGFFTNEALADCQPLARLLFSGLWVLADREGRLEDRPRKIKIEILPYDNCDADALLSELESVKLLTRYEVSGEKYIQITNFVKHQNPHPQEAASVIPSIEGTLTPLPEPKAKAKAQTENVETEPEQDKKSLNKKKNVSTSFLTDEQCSNSNSNSNSNSSSSSSDLSQSTRARDPADDDDFSAKNPPGKSGNGHLSKFDEDLCKEFVVAVLIPRGGVNRPGGLGHSIWVKGNHDEEIQAWLDSGKKPEQARRKGMAVQP